MFVSEAKSELKSVAHVANFEKLLKKYATNRQSYFQRGKTKYNDKYMAINVKRTKSALLKTKGFTDMSLFPQIFDELNGITAPKSIQNVCQGIIDFTDFLVEKFGAVGPGRLLKPEMARQSVVTFKKTLYKASNELPGAEAFKHVKNIIMQKTERLLDEVEYLKRIDEEKCHTLCCCLIGILVFRNACRISLLFISDMST